MGLRKLDPMKLHIYLDLEVVSYESSLVSPWPQLDPEDPQHGPVVRGLQGGAAAVLFHLDVVRLPTAEQDAVLQKQGGKRPHQTDSPAQEEQVIYFL